MLMCDALYLGWTTCHDEDVAERLAHDLIERKLAVCVQIESIRSIYNFGGALKNESELRLCVKCTEAKIKPIEAYIMANHPYEIPEWVVVQATHVSPQYLAWATG
jgi:periplasmic divalent cation tolerance protein